MADHFTLDVDLESLRLAKTKLGDLAEGLSSTGTQIARADDDLGSWTGPASEKIKVEVTALGAAVGDAAPKFTSAKEAVGTFVTAVNTFIEGPLADANREWERANQDATEDIGRLDQQFPDDEDKRDTRRGEIASGLRYALQGISSTYAEEKRALEQKAQALGDTLGGLTVVPVPESVATRFVAGGGNGTRLSFTDAEGSFPPDLHGNENFGGTGLSEDVDQSEAGAAIAARVNSGEITEDEAADLAAAMNGDSEAFRAAFLEALDPEALADYHELVSSMPHQGDGEDGPGALLAAIAQVLSRGSRSDAQSTYPVRSDLYDDLVDAYTDVPDDDLDPEAGAKGYLRLSELVAAGQGQPPTWDSDFLAEVTRRTVAYEREQVEVDEYWNWGDAGGELSWRTPEGAEWYGNQGDTDNPYWADPITLYFEAMADDTRAAQQVFTNGGSSVDDDLADYLYGRHAGHAGNYGWALSQALQSATSPVGPGGEGSPEYISAELVADLVDHYSDHDLNMQLEDGLANILTNHVQAVNHAGQGYSGAVSGNDPSGVLPYQRIALANLDSDQLRAVLTQVFGMDYWSNEVAEDEGGHDFPRYSQLALAMELAARDDVVTAAQHGDRGFLEQVVNELSQNQELANNAFVDGLVGQGRERDEANADARASLDFILGIAKDQVPTGKGVSSNLAGAGLDKIQELLVNAVIPESAYESGAQTDSELEDYRRDLNGLRLVEWLTDAGVVPEDRSPAAWAREHPDASQFVNDDGTIVDLRALYRAQLTGDEEAVRQWDDFIAYFRAEGGPYLAENDLLEQYTLGWLEEDSGR